MYFNCVEKDEIYVAAFGGHLFYDLFSQGNGGTMAPSRPLLLDPLLIVYQIFDMRNKCIQI